MPGLIIVDDIEAFFLQFLKNSLSKYTDVKLLLDTERNITADTEQKSDLIIYPNYVKEPSFNQFKYQVLLQEGPIQNQRSAANQAVKVDLMEGKSTTYSTSLSGSFNIVCKSINPIETKRLALAVFMCFIMRESELKKKGISELRDLRVMPLQQGKAQADYELFIRTVALSYIIHTAQWTESIIEENFFKNNNFDLFYHVEPDEPPLVMSEIRAE